MTRFILGVVLLAVLAGLLSFVRPAGRAQLQEQGGVIQPEVLAALQTGLEVEVIINLVPVPLPPPDQLSPETLEAYRQQVAAVQDRVLAKLTATDFTLTYRHSVSAALAGRITASGVEKLRGHPDVVLVALDRPLFAEPVGPGPSGPGDINCDGAVNSVDAALVLQYHAGLVGSLPCQPVADVNEDGEVDSRDAAVILQIEAGLCCIWIWS